MNTPTSGGHSAIRSLVTNKATTVSVTRPTKTTGARGGAESTSSHDVDVWLASPNEIANDTEYGERLTGSLAGLSLPTADLAEGDRLDYQGIAYEVEEIITTDSDIGDTVMAINLVRRTNDR